MTLTYEISQFEQDFQFLKEMKDILIEELLRIHEDKRRTSNFSDSDLKTGFYSETNDGREVRIILPGGFQTLWKRYQASIKSSTEKEHGSEEAAIGFVGFIGNKSEQAKVDKDLFAEILKLDTVLVRELADIEGMLAYVSGERIKGGDYGNLVLFKDRGVVQDLLKSSNHGCAVSELSPRYYSEVRIHSGTLPDGMTSPFFATQKTLFLFFTLPLDDPGRRRVQMWRARREDSDVMKVLPRSQSL